jgi:hypothetical protein
VNVPEGLPKSSRLTIVGRRPNVRAAASAQANAYARLEKTRRRNLSDQVAERNRKRILPGGAQAESRVPPGMRYRYHPNSVELAGLDAGAFIPGGLVPVAAGAGPVGVVAAGVSLLSRLLTPHHTPAQIAATVNRVVSAPLSPFRKLALKTGLQLPRFAAQGDQLVAISSGGAPPGQGVQLPIYTVSPPNPPPADQSNYPSVSPAFYNQPSETTGPPAPAMVAAPSSGVPSWLFPVAIGGLVYLLARRH